MRRSAAPSRKTATNTINLLDSEAITRKPVTEISNNQNEQAATAPSNPTEKENRKFYKVVWSKRSLKKHKIWENDGILELRNKFGILKDLSGTVIGTSNTIKNDEEISEGHQIIIGSKEIQIIEKLENQHNICIPSKINQKSELQESTSTCTYDGVQTEEHEQKIRKCLGVFTPNLQLPTTLENQHTNCIPSKITQKSKLQESASTCTDHKNVDPEEPKEKKRKVIGVFTPNLQLTKQPKVLSQKLPKLQIPLESETNNRLLLPLPNLDHQWKYNILKKPLNQIQVNSKLVQHLRPHQKIGITFLYECILGIRVPNYYGAILADDMGLGKTIQILILCCTLLKQGLYGTDNFLQRILIVTPSSLTQTWQHEIHKWLNTEKLYSYVVDSNNHIKNYKSPPHIPFVIVSYETLIQHIDEFQLIKFDLLVCDEGHRLKNPNIKITQNLKKLQIQRKILLTGTPIQNNLQEFYHIINFVNENILENYEKFKNYYELPICKSQILDAPEDVKLLGEQRSQELNDITKLFMLRRTQSINYEYLPQKREYIVFVRPSELQQLLLRKVIEWLESSNITNPLQIINLLKKICNHPSLIRASQTSSELNIYLEKYLPKWSDMGSFDSGKLELLQNFIKEISVLPLPEKIVIVSNHTKTLNMIQGLCDHLEHKYLRLDGQTVSTDRQSIVNKFNCQSNIEILIFLLSAKAGGVGLNLSGASRLILFDNDWNPATDLQAMSRIWRDGQQKNVKIYRLITAGTIEEKIFQRQIAKMSLGGCVMTVNDSNTTMKFNQEELKDLFTIQEADYYKCATHESLECSCNGNGEQPAKKEDVTDDAAADPYKINLNHNCLSQQIPNSLQMNELMHWQHYNTPISEDFLKEASLFSAMENINFIFSNQFEYST